MSSITRSDCGKYEVVYVGNKYIVYDTQVQGGPNDPKGSAQLYCLGDAYSTDNVTPTKQLFFSRSGRFMVVATARRVSFHETWDGFMLANLLITEPAARFSEQQQQQTNNRKKGGISFSNNDISVGKRTNTFESAEDVSAAALTPDESVLAVAFGSRIKLFRLNLSYLLPARSATSADKTFQPLLGGEARTAGEDAVVVVGIAFNDGTMSWRASSPEAEELQLAAIDSSGGISFFRFSNISGGGVDSWTVTRVGDPILVPALKMETTSPSTAQQQQQAQTQEAPRGDLTFVGGQLFALWRDKSNPAAVLSVADGGSFWSEQDRSKIRVRLIHNHSDSSSGSSSNEVKRDIAVSPNGRTVIVPTVATSGAAESRLDVFYASGGARAKSKPLDALHETEDHFTAVKFAPDGNTIIATRTNDASGLHGSQSFLCYDAVFGIKLSLQMEKPLTYPGQMMPTDTRRFSHVEASHRCNSGFLALASLRDEPTCSSSPASSSSPQQSYSPSSSFSVLRVATIAYNNQDTVTRRSPNSNALHVYRFDRREPAVPHCIPSTVGRLTRVRVHSYPNSHRQTISFEGRTDEEGRLQRQFYSLW